MFPENIIQATFQQQETVYTNMSNSNNETVTEVTTQYIPGMNILGKIANWYVVYG